MVAHFAAVPYRLKVFDEEVIASHSIGALGEEKYQNRGLLKLVGDKLMEDLVANNIPYTWGFPNRRAYEFAKVALVTDEKGQLIGGQVIASRMGARLGYEILDRVASGAILKDKPLLKSRHERLRDYLESTFGPIR